MKIKKAFVETEENTHQITLFSFQPQFDYYGMLLKQFELNYDWGDWLSEQLVITHMSHCVEEKNLEVIPLTSYLPIMVYEDYAMQVMKTGGNYSFSRLKLMGALIERIPARDDKPPYLKGRFLFFTKSGLNEAAEYDDGFEVVVRFPARFNMEILHIKEGEIIQSCWVSSKRRSTKVELRLPDDSVEVYEIA